MKKGVLTILLIISTCLLFGCSGDITPVPTLLPTVTSQIVFPTSTTAPLATPTTSPLTTPIPNESGLTIEENETIGLVYLDPLSFEPVNGSQQAIFNRHAEEKGETYSFGNEIVIDSGGHQYKAIETEDHGGWIITLLMDDETIFQADAGDVGPSDPLRGLWVEEGHWVLEFAYIIVSTENNVANLEAIGNVYRDGVSLNEQYGYEAIFSYQLLDGKIFYFYQQEGQIHLSYDGEDLPVWYDEIYHYNCCSGAILNPTMGSNWVGFWGIRDGVTYYTEIGKY